MNEMEELFKEINEFQAKNEDVRSQLHETVSLFRNAESIFKRLFKIVESQQEQINELKSFRDIHRPLI